MRKDRLLNVARALRESKNPDDFCMGRYGNTCGTPACALGHYAAREDLQNTFWLDAENDVVIGGSQIIVYDSKVVREHFDVDLDDAKDLFSGSGCGRAKTAIEAAEYIERFVARGGE